MQRTLATLVALVALAAAGAGSASAAQATPAVVQPPNGLTVDQWLSNVVGAPVHCYPTLAAYFADSGITPTTYWVGIAGFWGYSQQYGGPIVGLTPNTCANLLLLSSQNRWPNDYAAFTLAHEQAHALGRAALYATTHANDPIFDAQAAQIETTIGMSAGQAAEEAGADCMGAHDVTTVARALGLQSAAGLTSLLQQAKLVSGYVKIPAVCWPSG